MPEKQAAVEIRQPNPESQQTTAFLDLKAQFATIRGEVMAAIVRVMESQQFILGSEVARLEEELAQFLGARSAISCASGSDALMLALMALGVGPGDEVITPAFTFFATGGSIARVGAIPVFVDIDPRTFNIDAAKIEEAITSRTQAIMPVHLFGLPANMEAILEIAERKGLAIIEDAAQAMGARYNGRAVGTIGKFGCFSFFPSKNLGGAGDGGLITTQDRELGNRVRLLRVHGSRTKYHHEELGVNSRLDALQAAILGVKLGHLDEWTRKRRERAEYYRTRFEPMDLMAKVALPARSDASDGHVYNQFVIRVDERDALRSFLKRREISTEIYYPVPLHLQPAFAYLGKVWHLPESESASRQALALPIYPELKESQQEAVVGAIAEFYKM
jgi:dTDP-4-amino-4,6-dideoxygalactose transaminase